MGELFFEDFEVGGVLVSRTFAMTEPDIIAFGQAFDPLPMHTNPDSARRSIFGGVVASAFHTLQ